LAKSPDWLKAAPMWGNMRTSWRQSGQKKDSCRFLLNHNAKYKRLLPPCCDFANGVRSFSGSHNRMVFVPVRLEPLLRLNIMAAPNVTGTDARLWLQGELVHLEGLVPRDAEMDQRAPRTN